MGKQIFCSQFKSGWKLHDENEITGGSSLMKNLRNLFLRFSQEGGGANALLSHLSHDDNHSTSYKEVDK